MNPVFKDFFSLTLGFLFFQYLLFAFAFWDFLFLVPDLPLYDGEPMDRLALLVSSFLASFCFAAFGTAIRDDIRKGK